MRLEYFIPSYLSRREVSKPRWADQVDRTGFLHLASNELVHPVIQRHFATFLASLSSEDVRVYPLYRSALDAIASLYCLSHENITLTAGGDHAIKALLQAFCGGARSLILATPNYDMFEKYAELFGFSIVKFPYGVPKPFAFSTTTFLETLKAQRRSVIAFSNPNSPCGYQLSGAEIENLLEVAQAQEHLVIVDQVYRGFSGFRHEALLSSCPNLVVVDSFSKSYGFAGLRIGCILASPTITEALAPWSLESPVSGFAVRALEYLQRNEQDFCDAQKEIVESRALFKSHIEREFPSWNIHPSSANFLNVELESREQALSVCEELLRRRIRIRFTGDIVGLESSIRFTIADWQTMYHVLEELKLVTAGLP